MFWSRRQSVNGLYVEFYMKPIVLLSTLKKKAKQIKKERSLSWHQALDEASIYFGYSNYKNYRNSSRAMQIQPKPIKEVILKEISLENDIPKKMALAISFIKNYEIPFHDLFDIIKLFQHSDESLQGVCDKSNLKTAIQDALFRDFLTDEGIYEIHFRQPYFLPKDLSLSEISYEYRKDEDVLYIDGDYNLTTTFDFENIILENEGDCKDQRFNDRKLFGTFGITIDKNKNISIIGSDINEEIDGQFYGASFR